MPVVQSLGKNALKGHANPTLTYDVYDVTAPITAGKSVASVTLPNADLLHVFAIAVAPQTPVSPVFSSFEQALDNVAITDESAPNPPGLNGGFDGGGNTFDQQALNAATGLNGAVLSNGASPGATITYSGAVLRMPDVPAGTVDNVVGSGQTIKISGTGSAVDLLAAGAGATSGTLTVTYTDGSTTSTDLSVPSWYYSGQATGSAVPVVQSLGRNKTTGPANPTNHYDVYLLSAPIPAGKTVASLTMPTNGLFHLFALTVAP
ncbi:hypothetical protein GCM10023317_45800 [Actinopolymorpha pittospori]|uniref:Uncharacterized protein n=1 Tax=Actinopolymorpha pittospori TaxID=648752 RepID=A0A927MMK2_9ACTN|nr:hypothetical protein [Actinopolymorpha pittospori]